MDNNSNILSADVVDSTVLRENDLLLNILLKDYTTGDNIKWGTDSYISHGYSFQNDQEIKNNLITGWYEGFIRPRADKELEVQLERQRNRAEVFTPSWVIKLQVEAALEDMQELSLMDFIKTKWLEITCGEAPYMVNRYDMETGDVIPLNKRAGFIDVKFKKINEEIKTETEWVNLALEIYKASYGYEYQGDSLLLARENLILTFIDNFFYMFGAFPKNNLLIEISKIISWNVFQMDGLTYEAPYSDGGFGDNGTQLNLFEEIEIEENITPKLAKIKLWKQNKIIEFKEIVERHDKSMKFDVVIGNPPYQKEGVGDKARDEPMYNYFMDEAYKIGEKSILITPARFLFNAGQTPKKWNREMLKNPHLKVLYYETVSSKIFENTLIKGGIAITYYDSRKTIGPIGLFTQYEEMNSILEKIDIESINQLLYGKSSYKFTNKLYEDNPTFKELILENERKSVSSNIYGKIPAVFSNEKVNNTQIQILLREGNKRKLKWIEQSYIESHPNLDKYKVILPATNGSGNFGESLSAPEVYGPKVGHSQTFISFGAFDSKDEAENLLKYLKTKFSRAMLGTLKVTQHNQTKEVWSNVPLQDLTSNSDIDWSQTISDIDQQLYKKYNLTEKEIKFIENNVKEME